ncbi:MAG: CCA tRNA nucleotidyltransferase [Cyanobacteriota bacterium]|nr:CCA tRNA nucleotidyltransferase [Cyanobacteriota bacterium]
MKLPGVPPALWSALREAAGTERIALVGGAVRDWMLHHQHLDPWRGLVDLDLVIEASARGGGSRDPEGSRGWVDTLSPSRPSPAWRLVERLSSRAAGVTVRAARPHGQYGTVELELEVDVPAAEGGSPAPIRLLLDVASARGESYPVPAANPVVTFGALNDDLARRDLTINAMAIDLATDTLLDPHGGAADLEGRLLRFLHPRSLRDDPTRLVRAARYASRLGFALAPDSLDQAVETLATWPWPWRPGDPPALAPAALGTRLRRELELLVEQENWRLALARLQDWGGLRLLDPALQEDQRWPRRLRWAERLRLPPLVALLAAARHPLPLAERLQLPHRHHTLLAQFLTLRRALRRELEDGGAPPAADVRGPDTAWTWCQRLEAPGLSPSAVALALACGLGPRRPLLRWLLRWRHLGPACSSQELIAAGVAPGPALGAALRRSRQERLARERF